MEEIKHNLSAHCVGTTAVNGFKSLPNPAPLDPKIEELLLLLRQAGVPEPKYTMVKLILESNL